MVALTNLLSAIAGTYGHAANKQIATLVVIPPSRRSVTKHTPYSVEWVCVCVKNSELDRTESASNKQTKTKKIALANSDCLRPNGN